MEDNFNELDNLDLDYDQEMDNYYYDDEDGFDSDYDYYSYNEKDSIDRELEEDSYDEYSDDEDDDEYEEKPKKSDFRNIIFKVIIVLFTLGLLIWLGTLLFSANKTKKQEEEVVVVKHDDINIEETTEKLKNAALKYFNKEQLPSDTLEKTLTLKDLKRNSLVTKVSDSYDEDQTKAVLQKMNDEYLLTIVLYTDKKEKTREYTLNHYDYCIDTYLCEKREDSNNLEENEEINEEEKKEQVAESNSPTSWSSWSEYQKTSCDTRAVTCKEDDLNCKMEVKIYNKNEKTGTYSKKYVTTRNAFKNATSEIKSVCSLYDYVKVDGHYYRLKLNSSYKMLGAITKEQQSNYYEWVYQGRKSYQSAPSDTAITRYVFVGADYTNCGSTCTGNPNYWYDFYQFSSTINYVSNPLSDCSSVVTKTVPVFTITQQTITVSRDEPLYETICYKSTRTR